jgi:DNA helicase-2/ATP-dependent DNA helicase PcrA
VLLKEVVGWKGMDWKGCNITALKNFIGCSKANHYDPDSDGAREIAKDYFGWEDGRAVEAFHRYNEALAEAMLLTFDDFLVFAAKHLESSEEVRQSWSSRWDYMLQDEYQDANRIQKVIATLLAKDHRNYMAIGDCYQAIYSFRGSSPEYLAQFDQEWAGASTITLPRNYRSGTNIIDAANAVLLKVKIDGIAEPTPMIGERDIAGDVRFLVAESLDDEGNEIAARVLESVNAGESKLSDHTVLFRTNAQSRALEESFLGRRIPYVVVGGVSFYERKEVRDLLAYLRLAAGRATNDDVKRSINTPFRYLGAKFVDRVMSAVDRAGDDPDFPRIVDDVSDETGLQQRQRVSAREWSSIVRECQKRLRQEDERIPLAERKEYAEPSAILEHVIQRTRYIDYLVKEQGDESTEDSHVSNVREMVRVAEQFPTAGELLDYIDETIRKAREQSQNRQAGGDRVLLMNVHRSKGLEWKFVYVAGFNEGVFPHAMALKNGEEDEERRLAYVAITRARDVLTLSCARRMATMAGVRDTEPSRYYREVQAALAKASTVPAPPESGEDAEVIDLAEVRDRLLGTDEG